MKITVQYAENSSFVLNVKKFEYLGNFVMRLEFSTKEEKIVDFKPFLEKSLHPSIKKYHDEKTFLDCKIVDGNLNWNDYEMIFPISDLYNNNILRT